MWNRFYIIKTPGVLNFSDEVLCSVLKKLPALYVQEIKSSVLHNCGHHLNKVHKENTALCDEMIWMKTFCVYCSVRLGVIVSAVLSMIELIVPLIFIFVEESAFLLMISDAMKKKDDENTEHGVITDIFNRISDQPQNFTAAIEGILFVHLILCLFAIYGAIKLSKWFLVPYGIMEFLRFVFLLITHIIAMIVLKKNVDLGILIAATITGGFLLLFLVYRWAAVVALFQIIQLVNSEKYKTLYGEDPLQDWEDEVDNEFRRSSTSVFSMDNYDDRLTIKAWEAAKYPKNWMIQKSVAMIPIDEPDINLAVKEFRNWHLNELVRPRKSNLIKFY